MRAPLLLILLLLIAGDGPASAQRSLPVAPGERVRVTLPRETGERGDKRLRGEVLEITPDTLVLQLPSGTVRLGLARLRRVERSLGAPGPAESALQVGALLGATGAAELPLLDADERMFGTVGQAALVGAGVGAAVGAVYGALFPRERWERAPLPHDPPMLPDALRFPRLTIGGGWGPAGGEAGSGEGSQVMVGVRLAPLPADLQLRGELLYQHATVSEPFSCERVRPSACLGRGDDTRRFGAGLSLVAPGARLGKRALVYLPLSVGVIRSDITRSEHQGPIGICVDQGQIAGCPDDLPFATLRQSHTTTGVLATMGGGIAARVGGLNAWLEMRAQIIGERGAESAQFIPLSVGLSF